MKRTKLRERKLPDYTKGEEVMNMVTHIVGGGLGILALVLCVAKSVMNGSRTGIIASLIYGICMVGLYAMSSIYHGLRPGTAKRVMQVMDHCTIYFLIAGTYTPIVLCAVAPVYPAVGWGLLVFEWALTVLAVTLTAIDLKKYKAFSMVCYIGMGWAVLPFMKQAMVALTTPGFLWLLFGGIAYTIGAVLFAIGSKRRWFHSVFHIFVVLGSLLQFISVLFYAL